MQAKGDSPEAHQARTEMCQAYWFPLYAYLRSRGKSPEDAEDLTQEFFYHLIKKDSFAGAQREKGRLRTYLLTLLKNFDITEWRRAHTQRRGGQDPIISLDMADAEKRLNLSASSGEHPEREYDRKWAYTLLEDAMGDLQKDMATRQNSEELFQAVRTLMLEDKGTTRYEDFATPMGLTEGNLRLIVFRARRKFLKFLRQRVADTLIDDTDLDEELGYITQLFQRDH